MIKILLVDDQHSVRQGLTMRLALEPDVRVVGEAGDGRQALDLVEKLAPDVVIMDVIMPDLDGIAATSILLERFPELKVVILSLHADARTRRRAAEAGAVDFIEKRAGVEELLAAIRRYGKAQTV
jgi:DNA-binding NarL/FixJ family response regulator